MSAYLYDEALVDRLRSISGDGRIHIISPDNALSFLALVNKDDIQFPAIVVSRGRISLNQTKNHYSIIKGETVRVNEDNTATKIKVLPMTMSWTLNVYAVDRYSCDEIVRELILYFMNYPRLSVDVPYGINDCPQNFDVFVEDNIEDNSDLSNFSNTGEYFRETIVLYTTNAHLFASKLQYLTKVTTEVEEKENIN